jgi:hypothetical protein
MNMPQHQYKIHEIKLNPGCRHESLIRGLAWRSSLGLAWGLAWRSGLEVQLIAAKHASICSLADLLNLCYSLVKSVWIETTFQWETRMPERASSAPFEDNGNLQSTLDLPLLPTILPHSSQVSPVLMQGRRLGACLYFLIIAALSPLTAAK